MRTRARAMLVLALCVGIVSIVAVRAEAEVYHECDWAGPCWDCHENELNFGPGSGCANFDDNGFGYNGSCEHQSAFFWTHAECSTSYTGVMTCYVAGSIDCPGGDKSYYLPCEGSNTAVVIGARSQATCTGNQSNAYCDCDSHTGGGICQ